jgi:ribulose-5-phosphate 4-epimerase/fuculose-1-phosphate aldolase
MDTAQPAGTAAGLELYDPAAHLTPRQQLACCLRILSAAGWNENFAGHITWQEPGAEAMWCNPAGLWWNEVRASDVCLVDLDGRVLEGTRKVTEAIFIHTELHRRRPDARVVVHGHPYHATLLSALPKAPVITHQAGCVFEGELAVVKEYDGAVNSAEAGQHLADGVGPASGIILASHGALVTGGSVALATFRAITFERMCQTTLDLMKLGATAQEIDPKYRRSNSAWLQDKGVREYWSGAVRLLLQDAPDVLN